MSLISLAQIREQNLNDLTEALDRTPGVTTQRDNSIEKTYLIRGYASSAFHVDGSATLHSFNENWKPAAVWEGVRGPLYNLQALSTITPKHLLKAWTSWQPPGDLSRWSVGGNLHAQSGVEVEVNQCPGGGQAGFSCRERTSRLQMPGHAVLDLRAALQVDANWRVGLSVNNVLDKRYFESVSDKKSRDQDFWYGEPRNVLLKVEAAF